MKESDNLALYRKYRPEKWKDVIGQEHVVKTLEGAIKLGNISHAYLFSGSRGTGKTSVARIFARAIGTTDNDISEIDAASTTGVDSMRELTEAVNTLPFESPYKVYIIDEAHMLSKSAFNAFLKTLEEPPKHAVFILATTEFDKLPETIVSRCQTFTFSKPTHEILKTMILSVAKKEGFAIEPSSAGLITLLSDGSYRDAHGILQKIISASADNKISAEEVLSITGAPRFELVNDFISAIEVGHLADSLAALTGATKEGIDMKIYLKLVLQKIRFILLLKYAPDLEKEISKHLIPDDLVFLKARAIEKNTKISASLLSALLEASDSLARAEIPALPIELALIRIFGECK